MAWEMRAFRAIRVKLFFRPDQLEDDALRFVELPKLRTGSRSTGMVTDIFICTCVFTLSFSRGPSQRCIWETSAIQVYPGRRSRRGDHPPLDAERSKEQQEQVMAYLAGPYMASGRFGFKKGKTYDWAFKHLADAFREGDTKKLSWPDDCGCKLTVFPQKSGHHT